ncbi:MAG: PIN domain nuclease [Dehalococcoidia bacterium]|nr:MAG: PIN domain nuclease [Dehalococcoidia bacterium]
MRGELFVRILVAAILGIGGWRLAIPIAERSGATNELTWILSFAIGAYVFGFLLAPFIAIRPWRWAVKCLRLVRRLTPIHSLVAAAIGLALALVFSALIALPLSLLPDPWGNYAPLAAAVFFSCLFVPIMVLQGPGVLQFFFSGSTAISAKRERRGALIILDTNAIIDGRIADVIQTGFLQGTLLIPRFVLDELRHIADSHDVLRRNRGRRGLEMLTQLQRGSDIPVQISDIDFDDVPEVDSKLVMLAKNLRCSIVSNDLNLNQVAALQGVKVLNINELANAVKPVILPGEDMILRVVQEGKEAGQGVGFMDDGTMVVIEGGRRYLDTDVNITVTRVLQTAAGRMIFAQPKEPVDEKSRR